MALPASGAISTEDINTELDLALGASVNTDNAVLKGMALSSSDERYSTSDLYGTTARTLWTPKTLTMTIGSNTGSGIDYYGYNGAGGGYGSVSSGSCSFSNGVSGTFTQINVATGGTAVIGANIFPSNDTDFDYSSQVQGPKLTFTHSGSTKVINCSNGSVFSTIVACTTEHDVSWFSSRVGQTVTLTIEPR